MSIEWVQPFLEQSRIVAHAASCTKGLDKDGAAELQRFIINGMVRGIWDELQHYCVLELSDGTRVTIPRLE